MRRIWCFAAVLCISTLARADEASKHAKLLEYFQLTHMQDRVEQMKVAAEAQSKNFAAQQIASFGLPSDQTKSVDAYYKKLSELVASRYDWTNLGPAYEKIYADLYSEEEISAILLFYKSPIGQKLLAKTPEVTSRMLEVNRQKMEALTPQIQQMTADFMKQLQEEYGKSTTK
ncbi:hypothetical protein SAMN05421770_10735 [Granulicella rosea]|uniref:DUF2059 domain-containing protein n=1 Tax=Granulicella rosea TaxID=474952 RepID=A0A239LH19_9BACT|nr:DUF2059 domain-containing protein [Granulicella rosea]SNT29916.1 hypothetical protein SAMN05421770_10735 [Granulicella rosea]